jgi:hypothetical protein
MMRVESVATLRFKVLSTATCASAEIDPFWIKVANHCSVYGRHRPTLIIPRAGSRLMALTR